MDIVFWVWIAHLKVIGLNTWFPIGGTILQGYRTFKWMNLTGATGALGENLGVSWLGPLPIHFCFLTVTVTWPTLSSHCLTCLPWLSPGIPPLSHFFLDFFFIQASQYVLILIPGYGATSQCPQQLTMIDLPRVLARVWFCQLQLVCVCLPVWCLEFLITLQKVYKG